MSGKSDIIQQLQRDILSLQGFKPPKGGEAADFGLGPINTAFPNGQFPTGAVHEVISETAESAAASAAFVSGLLGTLMRSGGAGLWIGNGRKTFPMALTNFGIEPDRIVFVDLRHQKDLLWVMEEALKCEGLAAVIGEIPEIGFTASRRLQLAVEQSRVTGFILRHQPRTLTTNACVARWRINPMPSDLESGLPGVGFPRWNVELLKIRNGKPGAWPVEWAAGRFRALQVDVGLQGVEAMSAAGAGGAVGEAPRRQGVGGEAPGAVPITATVSEQKRKTG
jgi:protein ImuA